MSKDEFKDEAGSLLWFNLSPARTNIKYGLLISLALLYLPIANQYLPLCVYACVCVNEVCKTVLIKVKDQAWPSRTEWQMQLEESEIKEKEGKRQIQIYTCKLSPKQPVIKSDVMIVSVVSAAGGTPPQASVRPQISFPD